MKSSLSYFSDSQPWLTRASTAGGDSFQELQFKNIWVTQSWKSQCYLYLSQIYNIKVHSNQNDYAISVFKSMVITDLEWTRKDEWEELKYKLLEAISGVETYVAPISYVPIWEHVSIFKNNVVTCYYPVLSVGMGLLYILKYSGASHSDDNPCSKNRCKPISSLCDFKKPIGMH